MPPLSRLLAGLALLLVVSLTAQAQSPTALSYQGYLETAGAPVVNPSAALTFRLFSDPTGGSAVWTETKTGVAIEGGLFTTDLGTVTPLGPELFSGPLYLSVAVGGGPELTPRTALRASPYARTLVAPAQMFGEDAGTLLSVQNTASGSSGNGIYAETGASGGRAVYGLAASNSGANAGVYGQSESSGGAGVYGTGPTYGVEGRSSQIGVYGIGTDFQSVGVEGQSLGYGVSGTGGRRGVYGRGDGTTGDVYGVYGDADDSRPTAYAGFFNGRVAVNGMLTKGGGAFEIDHPLDPADRILRHSFVESPDMMNVYNGNAVLDVQGEATIELPAYFEALNRDFRYQLTALGAPGPNLFIAETVAGNRFRIAGGTPLSEVSWQVTGIRQDAWANANRIVVEEDKPSGKRGLYLHPAAFGLPREQGVDYDAAHEVQMERARAATPPALPRNN